YDVAQVGVFSPDMRPVAELSAGQVGYITAAIKRVADAKIGDTITETARPTVEPFPGYRDAKPMVFAGLYPIEDTEYEALRDALEKLRLNDPAFTYEPETSLALEPLLDDLHVQQAEEAAAETVAERERCFGLVGKGRIVEAKLFEGVAQGFILGVLDRVEAREHHRFGVPVAGEGLDRRPRGFRER